jgi:hypothetical protein
MQEDDHPLVRRRWRMGTHHMHSQQDKLLTEPFLHRLQGL